MSDVHSAVSHPSVSAVPAVHRPCVQDPCGGAFETTFDTQLPLVHVSLLVHTFPHVPQLLLSVDVSTQEPVHSVPVVHWHVLLVHVAPEGQALPQLPQFEESLVVSTHTPLHSVPAQVVPLSGEGGGGGGGLVPLSFPGLVVIGVPAS